MGAAKGDMELPLDESWAKDPRYALGTMRSTGPTARKGMKLGRSVGLDLMWRMPDPEETAQMAKITRWTTDIRLRKAAVSLSLNTMAGQSMKSYAIDRALPRLRRPVCT
jgi:hypothetical protein